MTMSDVASPAGSAPNAVSSVAGSRDSTGAPASVPQPAPAPTSAWHRHLWLWLSLIGAGIAIVFFSLGFATSSLVAAASHSVHQIFGGDDHRSGPAFGPRHGSSDGTDGSGEWSFPGQRGDGSGSDGGRSDSQIGAPNS